MKICLKKCVQFNCCNNSLHYRIHQNTEHTENHNISTVFIGLPGQVAWESVGAFQTEILCCHSLSDLTHSETFEKRYCPWIETGNHLVRTVRMFVNSSLFVVLGQRASVDCPQGSLDWCKSETRSGWGQTEGRWWSVPWGERSRLPLLDPCGVLQ